ncbi:MAG: GtrA family protein [Lachnospiraceae bacterium]|nr:GtrA family protein [Lachnospiraceae bacterium]
MKERLTELSKKYVNRETVSYLIFGVLTTLVDWVIFTALVKLAGMNHLIANIISTASAIVFAFFTNKRYVFQSLDYSAKTIVPEFIKFVGSRLFTFGVQELLLYLTVDLLGLPPVLMKMITSAVVIILNYFFSKLLIFVRKEKSDAQEKNDL